MNRRLGPLHRPRTTLLTAATLVALTAAVLPATASATTPTSDAASDAPLNSALTEAAERFDVPRDLLTALGYSETRLTDHQGQPSQANGYGVMHLVDNAENRSLRKAATLTGRSASELRQDTTANIEGGAAVLRAYADELGLNRAERGDLDAWYPVVARYSGAESGTAALYADTVYDFLAKGLTAKVDGERIAVPPRQVTPDKGTLDERSRTLSPDYPDALWVPASTSNYVTGRSAAIDTVVIHVTQGSYAGSISWFQNPESQVSAHYVIQSSDGEITQMVRDADTAWHARSANSYSLGIEHEGWIDDPSWFTDTMYRSSAALTRHLCDTYGIPIDRQHIIGHVEAPGNDHTDPGPYWDWDYYMSLVSG